MVHRCDAKNMSKSKCTKHLSAGPSIDVTISKSKCTKNLSAGPIFDVTISKNGTPLWSHVRTSKCKKTEGFGPLLDVPMSKYGTPLWREVPLSIEICKKAAFSDVEKVSVSVSSIVCQLPS